MPRWLGWFGLGILVTGVFAAFLARLWLPARLLQFGFGADPAVTILVVALLLALVLLSISAYSHWQTTRTQHALAAQAESLKPERRRFIQRLDHELKNPLTAIQVQLDNLQELGGDDAQALARLREQADPLSSAGPRPPPRAGRPSCCHPPRPPPPRRPRNPPARNRARRHRRTARRGRGTSAGPGAHHARRSARSLAYPACQRRPRTPPHRLPQSRGQRPQVFHRPCASPRPAHGGRARRRGR